MDPAPQIPDLTLLRKIGHGSYGDVWIARTLTGVYRAVKVVARARFEDDRPFLRELDGITRFQQSVGDRPRQLALMHVGRDDERGLFYYVMELADDAQSGTDIDPEKYQALTLKEYMRRGPVTAADAVRLGIELAEALKELHAAGLIHRDVKPSNIIFVGGMPKLADIGLVSSSDHTLTSLGTPGYSPPEGAGTVKADVYSLGKILYQLVTGLPPQDFPRLPPDLMDRADANAVIELNDVVLRACDPDPQNRYASAQEMLDDLLLLQAGKSVQEFRRLRRHLRTLGRVSAVAAVLVAIALGVLGWSNYRQAQALTVQERAAREQAERDERLARYSADLNVAQLALVSGDYGVARTALRRQMPGDGEADQRGLEWWAMWNDTAGDAVETYGEIGASGWRIVLPSPDGQAIALQNIAGETWIAQRGSDQRRKLADGTNGLAGFNADGTQLLVGTQDRRVRWVDVASGVSGPELPVTGRLQGVGDGRRFVIGERAGNGIVLQVWDLAEGRESGRWESGEWRQELQLGGAALSPDGTRLAICLFWTEGTVPRSELLVWHLMEQQVVARSSEIAQVHAVRFSPDGRWIAVGMSGQPVQVFDASSGEIRHRLDGPAGAVTTLAFSRDERTLAAGGRDQVIRIWDLASGTGRVLRGHEGSVQSLVFADDATRIVSGSADGTWRVWDAGGATRRVRTDGLWAGVLGDAVFSPANEIIAATDREGRVAILNSATLEVTRTLDGVFQALAFENSSLIGVSRDLRLVRADLENGEIQPTDLQPEGMTHVAVMVPSRDGTRALLGFRHGEVELWDLRAARSLGRSRRHEGVVRAGAISDDGAWALSGDVTGSVWLWSATSGEAERQLIDVGEEIASLAFAGDQDRILVGLASGLILVLDGRSGEVVEELHGHSGHVDSMILSRDGTRLCSAGKDGLVVIWTLPGFRPIATLVTAAADEQPVNRGIYRLNLSPQGSELSALTQDGRLRLWRLMKRD